MIKFFEVLRPPKLSSWQTFVCVMLALFILAVSAEGILRESLAIASFLSGTVGVTWAGLEKKWLFTPWLTIALLDVLAWQKLQLPVAFLVVTWPPLAALLWLVPKSFKGKSGQWEMPDATIRQRFILIFASQVLFSCWLQFSFVIQTWLDRYPSLRVDTFEQSVFVTRLDDGPMLDPRGLTLLQAMRPRVEDRLEQQDWSSLEPWLQEIWVPHRFPDYLQDLKSRIGMTPLPEDVLWEMTVAATRHKSGPVGYDVVWLARWTGPRSNAARQIDPYTSVLRCTVVRQDQRSEATCEDPVVVDRPVLDANGEDLNERPWWRRLRLLPGERSDETR
ncbi:MAG: DUF5357 family protein [Cyanobacteria bacterium P01_G01_bin.54]